MASFVFSGIMALSMMCPVEVTRAFAEELQAQPAQTQTTDTSVQSDVTVTSDTSEQSDVVATQADATTDDTVTTVDEPATTDASAAEPVATHVVTLTATDGATFAAPTTDGVTLDETSTIATFTLADGTTLGDTFTADTLPQLAYPDGATLGAWALQTADGLTELTVEELLSYKVSADVAFSTELVGTTGDITTMSSKVIYWNPSESPVKNGDTELAPAGNDVNSGVSSDYPVLTWDRVKQIYEGSTGYTVYVMSTAVLGSQKADNSGAIVPSTLDIQGKSGTTDYNVTFTTWAQNAVEMFLVPCYDSSTTPVTQAGSLTVANVTFAPASASMNSIRVAGADSSEGTNAAGGQLTIGAGFRTTSPIQYELDDAGRSLKTTGADAAAIYNPLVLNAKGTDVPQRYEVYYSGVNSSLTYQYANVVVAGANGPSDIEATAETYFVLSTHNTDAKWSLVYDGAGMHPTDQGQWNRNTLELYCQYEYSAVYVNPTVDTSGYGGSCDFPVKTLDEAKTIVETGTWVEGVPRIIYLCSTIDVAADTTIDLAADRTAYGTKVYACPSPVASKTHAVVTTMFDVAAGASLTLKGVDVIHDIATDANTKTAVNHVLVQVDAGGSLSLEGSNLIGGVDAAVDGWGVKLTGNDTDTTSFTMDATSSITNNTRGIQAIGGTDASKTVLSLNGGTISGNVFKIEDTKVGYTGGAGVYASHATIKLAGTTVEKNTAVGIRSWPSTLAYGAGIYADSCDVTMTAGAVSSNAITMAAGGGAGIYQTGGDFRMSGGEISNNKVDALWTDATGAGISYSGTGTVDVSGDVTISGNTGASKGGGLFVSGTPVTGSTRTVSGAGGATFSANTASNGGAIYATSDTPLDVESMTFSGAAGSGTSVGYGGALYLETSASHAKKVGACIFDANAASFAGSAIYTTGGGAEDSLVITGCEFKNCKNSGVVFLTSSQATVSGCNFHDNTSTALYLSRPASNATYAISNCTFTSNSSFSCGAACSTGDATFTDCTFEDNKATTGSTGALRVDDDDTYVSGCTFTGNSSVEEGGAIKVSSGASLYLYGSADKTTTLSNNSAGTYGGGLALAAGSGSNISTAYIEEATFDDNTASAGGANIYNAGTLWMVGGTYKHTGTDSKAIYNDISSKTPSCALYLDPTAVTLDHDEFYLNNALSKVWLLKDPGSATFPISINTEVFKSGSVVVTPSSKGWTDHAGTSHSYSESDVSGFASNFQGGALPTGTSVLGYDKDLILSGQGVYLDGQNGNDNNTGADPNHPVKTWGTAVTKLKAGIAAANAAGTTFEPYIYVVGTVGVSSDTTWSLDYATDTDLTQTSRAYDDTWHPEVARFASFYGSLVDVTGGTLAIDHVTLDGRSGACSPSNDSPSVTDKGVNPLASVEGGAQLNLGDGTKLQDNYGYGVGLSRGTLRMTGTSYVGNNRNDAINASDGSAVLMFDTAEVNVGASLSSDADVSNRAGVSLAGRTLIDTHQDATLSMVGKSRIETMGKTGVRAGVYSQVTMGSSSDIETSFPAIEVGYDTENGYSGGTGIQADASSSVTMGGYSQICFGIAAEDAEKTAGTGYRSAGSTLSAGGSAPSLTMNDHACLTRLSNGIVATSDNDNYVSPGPAVILNGSSSIDSVDTGISLQNSTKGASFTFNDDSSISGASDNAIKSDSRSAAGVIVAMNGNATFTQCGNGIVGEGTDTDWKITMTDQASISNLKLTEDGGDVASIWAYAAAKGWTINLDRSATIDPIGSQGLVGDDLPIGAAIRFGCSRYDSSKCGGHTVTLDGSASLVGCNKYAYFDEGSGSTLTLKGNATIDGGAANANTYQEALVSVSCEYAGQTAAITLQDNATIKNAHYYDNPAHDSSNNSRGLGIKVENSSKAACVVTLADSSSVSGNFGDGIHLDSTNGWSGGASYNLFSLTMSGTSSVTGNGRRGIYLYSGSGDTTYTSATLGAGTRVSGNASSYADVDLLGRQIYSNAGLTLDVATTVDGEIYLPTVGRIITLTDTTGVGADKVTDDKFTLGYAALFAAERVVAPSASVADATAYLAAFKLSPNATTGTLVAGSGTDANYIVTGQQTEVYLAGDSGYGSGTKGDDSNSGKSPATPVRTFARAKQILKGLPEGANIIICNYSVDPTTLGSDSTDLDWSFDAGGTFTNDEGKTWVPKIVIYDEGSNNLYNGMINVQDSSDSSKVLNLTNLTFQLNKSGEVQSGSSYYNRTVISTNTSSTATINVNGCTFVNGAGTAIQAMGSKVHVNVTACDFSNYAMRRAATESSVSYVMNGDYLYCSNGATLTVDGCSFDDAAIQTDGFNYIWNSGNLVVKNCTFDNNVFSSAWDIEDGAYQFDDSLRGCLIRSGGGSVTLSNDSFDGNTWNLRFPSDTAGTLESTVSGAALSFEGTVSIKGCTVDGNSLTASGTNTAKGQSSSFLTCGIVEVSNPWNSTSSLSISDSSISNNTVAGGTAVAGVGLCVDGADAELYGTDIDGNKVIKTDATLTGWPDGDEEWAYGVAIGAGICAADGANVTLRSGSVSGNVSQEAPGIYIGEKLTNSKGEETTPAATVTLAGGTVSDNTCYDSNDTTFEHAGICAGGNLVLKGGRAVVDDRIYLADVSSPITLAGSIYQKNRTYLVDCNVDGASAAQRFGAGSVVVKPDGDAITSATDYEGHFTVSAGGYMLAKQVPNLVLKAYVFLDGDAGSDTNDGSTPAKAFKTLAGAKTALVARGDGVSNTVFLVSGPLGVSSDEAWSLADSKDAQTGEVTSEILRYTGFGVAGGTSWPAYTGPMVTVSNGGTLSLSDITIMGRRDSDDTLADSIVKVGKGSSLNLGAEATLAVNENTDVTLGSGKGGAIYSEGKVSISDGAAITGTSATSGDAIYAATVDGTPSTLDLSGASIVLGTAYLEGTGTSTADAAHDVVVNVSNDYVPDADTQLSISLQNSYEGRAVVVYPDGHTATSADAKAYQLDSNVGALYRLDKRSGQTNVLELQTKAAVYIDGQAGSDEKDGTTPDTSVKTLKRAYEVLKAAEADNPNGYGGGIIKVVGAIDVDSSIKLVNIPGSATTQDASRYIDVNNSANDVETAGTVYIRRYSQPTAWKTLTGYASPSNTDSLIYVGREGHGGSLYMSDMIVQGHSEAIDSSDARYAAPGVQAMRALVEVYGGSTFDANWCEFVDANNANDEGLGGALLVYDATANLHNVTISNTSATYGDAIYNGGNLTLDSNMDITGSIYLAGSGSESTPDSSRFITVSSNGTTNASGRFDIEVQDPYRGRTIVDYPEAATSTERASYSFEDSVSAYYSLRNRTTDQSVLELQFKTAIYIDGFQGNDTNDGLTADTAVKTLAQAYKLLQANEGACLYVVDTVTTTSDITLTSTSYKDANTTITLDVNPIEIYRYAKPTATVDGFTHASNTATLLKVDSGMLTIEDLVVDGHKDALSNPTTGNAIYPDSRVASGVSADSALLSTGTKGSLQLNTGAVLQNNNNASDGAAPDTNQGGAVCNLGSTYFNGATITGNVAGEGAAVFQDGVLFSIESIDKDSLGDQGIYLASEEAPTKSAGAWTDAVITVDGDVIPDDVSGDDALAVDMDHAVRSRDVITFTDGSYTGELADQSSHLRMGDTVKGHLVLGVATDTANTLELQDYTTLTITTTWVTPAGWTAAKPSVSFKLANASTTGDDVTTTVNVDNSTRTPTCDHGTVAVNGNVWTITVTDMPGYEGEGTSETPISYTCSESFEGQKGYKIETSAASTTSFSVTNTPQGTVTYHADDATSGTVPDSVAVTWGSGVTVASNSGNLARAGYTFVGWNTKADGTGTHYNPSQTVKADKDIDLYAMWVGPLVKSSTEGLRDGTLRPDEQLGYTISVDTTEACTLSDVLPAGVTYVNGSATDGGVYDAQTRTVTWNFSAGQAASRTVTLAVTVNGDTAAGTKVDNKAVLTVGGNTYDTNTDSWQVAETHRVLYDGNGATGGVVPTNNLHMMLGETIRVSDNTGELVRDGYSFAGWNTAADGTGTHYAAGDMITMGTADITLNAMWVQASASVSKSDPTSPAAPGSELTYDIDLSAPEGGDVMVVDVLPEGLDYVEGSASDNATYDSQTRTITWTFPGTDPGTTKKLTFKATISEDAKSGDSISNQATVTLPSGTYVTNVTSFEVGESLDAQEPTVVPVADKTTPGTSDASAPYAGAAALCLGAAAAVLIAARRERRRG